MEGRKRWGSKSQCLGVSMLDVGVVTGGLLTRTYVAKEWFALNECRYRMSVRNNCCDGAATFKQMVFRSNLFVTVCMTEHHQCSINCLVDSAADACGSSALPQALASPDVVLSVVLPTNSFGLHPSRAAKTARHSPSQLLFPPSEHQTHLSPPAMAQPWDYIAKIVSLGDSGSGKSSVRPYRRPARNHADR